MTWSVPLGYTFNDLYITPTIYMHFLFLFGYSMLVTPIKSSLHFIFVLFIRYYLVNQTSDVYLDASIAASIWCYIGVVASKIGIQQMIVDLVEKRIVNAKIEK